METKPLIPGKRGSRKSGEDPANVSMVLEQMDESKATYKVVLWSVLLSFVLGSLLVVALKSAAFILSKEADAVKTSLMESTGDCFSQLVLLLGIFSWNNAKKYPKGSHNLQSTHILAFAMVMVVMTAGNLYENAEKIWELYFGTADGALKKLEWEERVYLTVVLILVLLIKVGLYVYITYFLQKETKADTAKVLAQDHIQDAVTNLIVQFAIHAPFLIPENPGDFWLTLVKYLDPVLASGLGMWVMYNWGTVLWQTRNQLVEKASSPEDVDGFREYLRDKHPQTPIKDLIVVNRANNFVVYIDIQGDLSGSQMRSLKKGILNYDKRVTEVNVNFETADI